jgi:hypothetical protein
MQILAVTVLAKKAAPPTPNYTYYAPVRTPNSGDSLTPTQGYISAEIAAGIVGGKQQPLGIGPA